MESQYDSTSRTPPIIIQLFCRLVRAKLDINAAKLVVLLQTTLERILFEVYFFLEKLCFVTKGSCMFEKIAGLKKRKNATFVKIFFCQYC